MTRGEDPATRIDTPASETARRRMRVIGTETETETETERGILTVAGSHGTKRGQGATGQETRMTDTTLSPPGEMTATPAGTDTSSPTGTGITGNMREIIFKIASLLMEHTLVTANKYLSI